MKKAKRFLKLFLWAGGVFLLLSVIWNAYVSRSVKNLVHADISSIEDRHTGLLLGTSKYIATGKPNLYYEYRIASAAALYRTGMIDYVLVSGDNGTVYYNEPAVMLKDLVAAGVPKECIVQDFAGFRTLDSVVRSQKVFGEEKVTIISQRFHVERALFLAKHYNIAAIGFCADDVDAYYGAKTMVREHFARVKLFIDLYVLDTQPKFLGEPIEIPS
jgi:SanA protein